MKRKLAPHRGRILLLSACAIGALFFALYQRKQPWRDPLIKLNLTISASLSQLPPLPPLPPLPSAEFYVNALNAKSLRRHDSFDPQISAKELTAMLRLFWIFLDLCEQHNIQVMLSGGSLIGSYRHHGVIPWDDDVDLLLKESDQEKLEAAMRRRPSGMELTKAGRWKVWNRTKCLNKLSSFCWPYIDLSFYRVRGDVLYDTVQAYGRNYSYPTRLTFPTHKRPFMGRWVDSPRDGLRFLGYDMTPSDQCVSMYFSHKFERVPKSPVKQVSCANISQTYPFVIRVPEMAAAAAGAIGVLEELRLPSGYPVYSVPVAEPAEALNYEYSFVPIK